MLIVVLLFAFVIGQAFWSYKLRCFFRIFPGFFAGLLVSFTTGCLLFMDGFRGDAVRLENPWFFPYGAYDGTCDTKQNANNGKEFH